jgi:ribosome biogenesis GTPase
MNCQFNDCSHTHEPGCAVLAALKAGKIYPQRYESYLRLKAGDAG